MILPDHRLSDEELAGILLQKGTVWLDGAVANWGNSPHSGENSLGETGNSYLFEAPLFEVVAFSISEVPFAFNQLDEYLSEGYYVAGYVAYEAGYAFEKASFKSLVQRDFSAELNYPLLWFGVYKEAKVFSATPLEGKGPEAFIANLADAEPPSAFTSSVERIRDLIAQGDVYQINLTTRFKGEIGGVSEGLFDVLRKKQPVEFGAFLRTGWVDVLSFSPELFFRHEGNRIEARPMKGTAPRGSTQREDEELKKWLSEDTKNRAENLMIVDLLRNDLSVVCEAGSVKVPKLFEVTSLPTVHQMSSTIEGTLKPKTGLSELFRALFPCGSITGAPKIRAMQRIAELEREPRGVYCGAIGFAAPYGSAPSEGLGAQISTRSVFSVGIRTATVINRKLTYGAGGGIVWDSDPDQEYEEAELKTRFLRSAEAPPLQLIETMLWGGCANGIQWVEFHLDRLQDSATQLGFDFNRTTIKNEIEASTNHLGPGHLYRIRLLLDTDGRIDIKQKPFEMPTAPLRVGLSKSRTSSNFPLFRHKTTHRSIYDRGRLEASAQNVFDVLFTNERGEITEGSITNVFAFIDNGWYTPPLTSGLLPGVGRRIFMLKHSARERILTPKDLRSAKKLCLTNALIGAMEATWVDL
ncbi:MAG: aminodeoxychorismate synthase component I [Bacteroidetes bacterium]|nr:aminodeoxychorismate synthase component I [Bacteroidota bacterium]